MNNKNDNRHMVDILFVIALFCVFALSALMLVIIGSNVYKKTVTNMDNNFDSRTSFSYITEKVRQNDAYNAISIVPFGDTGAICISENHNNINYVTYLYQHESNLCELNTRADIPASPAMGTKILPIEDFNIQAINDSLYCANITSNGTVSTVYINIRSNRTDN